MPDPITLTLGTVALTEGVKFLYGQAGELIKHWREHRDTASKEGAETLATASAQVTLPTDVFEGNLTSPQIHHDALTKLAEPMIDIKAALSSYAEGDKDVDPANQELLAKVNALRDILEAVYQQRLTFKGEARPASGPIVGGHIDVDTVKQGVVGGVVAKTVSGSASLHGTANAKLVEGGTVGGTVIDEIRGG